MALFGLFQPLLEVWGVHWVCKEELFFCNQELPKRNSELGPCHTESGIGRESIHSCRMCDHDARVRGEVCPPFRFPSPPPSLFPQLCPTQLSTPTAPLMSSFTPPPPSSVYALLPPEQQHDRYSKPDLNTNTSHGMLLDVTTIQGLLLYTAYLLHRLRFFRWAGMRRITAFCNQQLSKARWEDQQTDHDPDQKTKKSVDYTNNNGKVNGNGEIGIKTGTEVEESVGGDDAGSILNVPGDSPDTSTAPTTLATTHSSSSLSDSKGAAMVSPTAVMVTSINDKLPPEVLSLVFVQLGARMDDHHHPSSSHRRRHHRHGRNKTHLEPVLTQSTTLLRCLLVCRSWYELIAPMVWKSPRVLWSTHWSRFFPCVHER